MQSECRSGGSGGMLAKTYTCFYIISMSASRNISIEFRKFELKDGSRSKCGSARQIMILEPAGTMGENMFVVFVFHLAMFI